MASKKPSLAGDGLGLFTDFVQGVREGLKHAGGTDKQLEGLREESLIATVVGLLMVPVRAVLQFLDRTISITPDLSKTMTQLIADGRYDWVNGDVAKHFSIASGQGVHPVDVHLLHYNKQMTSDQVLADVERQGLRPVTFQELLWIGIQHPELQRTFPIIALGTVVQVHGYRYVACLGRGDRERSLYLRWSDGEWHEVCRFAAVRK